MKWPRLRKAAALASPQPAQETQMPIFSYTDPLGDALFVAPASNEQGPVVSFRGVMRDTGEITVVHVPVDSAEQVITAIRDAGREAVAQVDPAPVTAAPSVPPGRTPGRSS